jgi:hypothetical protein
MNYYTIIEFIFIKLQQHTMHNIDLYKILGFILKDLPWRYTAITRARKHVFSYAS